MILNLASAGLLWAIYRGTEDPAAFFCYGSGFVIFTFTIRRALHRYLHSGVCDEPKKL